MPVARSFDYALLRIVPRVERGEFVNAGVVLFSSEHDFLDACVHFDPARLRALFAGADLDAIDEHLRAVPRVCAGGEGSGPIGKLSRRERFHWLVSPRSTVVQVSPVHSGLTEDPAQTLAQLMNAMVLEPGR